MGLEMHEKLTIMLSVSTQMCLFLGWVSERSKVLKGVHYLQNIRPTE